MSKLEWIVLGGFGLVVVYLSLIADRLGRIQDRVRLAARPMDPDGTDQVPDTLHRIEASVDVLRSDVDRIADGRDAS